MLPLCLEKDWTAEDKNREQELMSELVTIIEQRNQIVNNMDQDRQRYVAVQWFLTNGSVNGSKDDFQ